jgi:hypothetical protein
MNRFLRSISLLSLGLPTLLSAQFPTDTPSCVGKQPEAIQLWCKGGEAFVKRDLKAAIKSYEKLYKAERQQRTLGVTPWRVMIDNLGMAYGMSDELDKSQAVLQYGVSQDSTYPLFYYNLACVHAARGAQDSTLAYLRQAFRFKANVIAGETMPDPWTDDSFTSFLASKPFADSLAMITPRGAPK